MWLCLDPVFSPEPFQNKRAIQVLTSLAILAGCILCSRILSMLTKLAALLTLWLLQTLAASPHTLLHGLFLYDSIITSRPPACQSRSEGLSAQAGTCNFSAAQCCSKCACLMPAPYEPLYTYACGQHQTLPKLTCTQSKP